MRVEVLPRFLTGGGYTRAGLFRVRGRGRDEPRRAQVRG
jgi:hypothetical protein